MSYINRFTEKNIKKVSKSFPVVLITGSRQVGKTTILRHFADTNGENINFVTLDDMSERIFAKEDPKGFLETHKYPLIIDEFQYAPELLSYIKIIVDNLRYEHLKNTKIKCNGLFFLTGSQSFLSMEKISESLAGRISILELYGLSTREIFKQQNQLFNLNISKNKNKNFNISIDKLYGRIFNGSFPEIWNNDNIDIQNFYSSYINTYIKRDIRELINIKDELKFSKFLTELAVRTSQELNLNSITNDIEISNPTAKDWLSILVNTGLIYLLKPYSANTIKRIVKKPKLYFLDTGLAIFLAKYKNIETLMSSQFAGPIYETYVISEIIKSYVNNGLSPDIYYYRDNANNEIDLIYEENNTIYPLEIKKTSTPNISDLKNFRVLKSFNKNIGSGSLICNYDHILPLNQNLFSIPATFI